MALGADAESAAQKVHTYPCGSRSVGGRARQGALSNRGKQKAGWHPEEKETRPRTPFGQNGQLIQWCEPGNWPCQHAMHLVCHSAAWRLWWCGVVVVGMGGLLAMAVRGNDDKADKNTCLT